MALLLSSGIMAQLRDWAAKAEPEECCGLLIGHGGKVETAILAENVATDRKRRFEIDPVVLIAAEKSARSGGALIIGYFHSHPAPAPAVPSSADVGAAANDGRVWVIVAGGAVSAWAPRPDMNGEIEAFDAVTIIEG